MKMSKVKIKMELPVADKADSNIRQSLNEKISDATIDYGSVPRIGEWIDLLELAKSYNLTEEELNWLSGNEHKYQIENVNKCEGFIEVELDIDKIWPEEA
jgi:hypothetical protein